MRLEFSRTVKRDALKRSKWFCEKCTAKLSTGKFEFDHIQPANDGGEATLENCRVLCVNCHKGVTKVYVRELRKAERIRDKHSGALCRSGEPMAGSRKSAWKHTFNHGWVRRDQSA